MPVEIAPVHAIGVLISLALIYQSARLVKKRKESVFEFFLWTSLGIALLTLTVSSAVTTVSMRNLTSQLFRNLGFSDGLEGLFAFAIFSLLLMLFYTYINTKTNRQDLYELNQEIAILRYQAREQNPEEETELNSDD